MNFEIKFEAYEEGKERVAAWRAEDRRLGLDFLDRVRKELDVPNLDHRRVDDMCRYNWDLAVSCAINEEEARRIAERTGLFRASSRITVRVPRWGLNRYLKIDLDVHKNAKTGEIERVYPEWCIDKDAAVRDWIAAGCPLVWALDSAETADTCDESSEGI